MGLFDSLFKHRKDLSETDAAESAMASRASVAEPAPLMPATAESQRIRANPLATPPHNYVLPPAPSGAAPERKEPAVAPEIVVTLGDILSRIPTQFLQPGMHDAQRELHLWAADVTGLDSPRPTVPLARLAAQCREVFDVTAPGFAATQVSLPIEPVAAYRESVAVRQSSSVPASEEATALEEKVVEKTEQKRPEPADEQVVAAETAGESRDKSGSPISVPPLVPSATSVAATLVPPQVRPVVVQPPHLIAPAPVSSAAESAGPPTADAESLCAALARMPGVQACILSAQERWAQAGELPAGVSVAAVRELVSRLDAASIAMTALVAAPTQQMTLHGNDYSLAISRHGDAWTCAVLRTRAFLPGVRERLSAAAVEFASAAR